MSSDSLQQANLNAQYKILAYKLCISSFEMQRMIRYRMILHDFKIRTIVRTPWN